jgi:hypothetical protein
MTTQMLVQLPLLVAAGWLLSRAFLPRDLAGMERWNHSGITGLVLVSVTAVFWMLPRSLDAAISHPLVAAAKYLTVPLLIGLPFGVSWSRMGFVVRGVFLMEFVATFFRLGWLYLISPIRLCNNYALNDQQRLGGYMLAIGGGLLLWLVWKLLWGSFESSEVLPAGWTPRRANDAKVTGDRRLSTEPCTNPGTPRPGRPHFHACHEH